MHSVGITAVTKEELFQIFNNLKDSSAGCDDNAACVVKSTYEYNYWCIVAYLQFVNTEWYISEWAQTSKGCTLIQKWGYNVD